MISIPQSIDAIERLAAPSPKEGTADSRSVTVVATTSFRFRNYLLEPSARSLRRDGKPVEIGSRAFDLLLVLLRSRGTVVSKEEIVRHVWPTTIVDESNLRFQVTSLRGILGNDRDVIKTVPGRGYILADESFSYETSMEWWADRGPPVSEPIWDSKITDDEGAELEAGADVDGPKVAIIEDDRGTREALSDLLRSAGLVAESYGSTQAFMQRSRPDLTACIVLDVLLPGKSGLEFQGELTRSGSSIPIIFISGHADVHMGVQAMKGGAFEFLTKPVRHGELIEAISRAMAQSQ